MGHRSCTSDNCLVGFFDTSFDICTCSNWFMFELFTKTGIHGSTNILGDLWWTAIDALCW